MRPTTGRGPAPIASVGLPRVFEPFARSVPDERACPRPCLRPGTRCGVVGPPRPGRSGCRHLSGGHRTSPGSGSRLRGCRSLRVRCSRSRRRPAQWSTPSTVIICHNFRDRRLDGPVVSPAGTGWFVGDLSALCEVGATPGPFRGCCRRTAGCLRRTLSHHRRRGRRPHLVTREVLSRCRLPVRCP